MQTRQHRICGRRKLGSSCQHFYHCPNVRYQHAQPSGIEDWSSAKNWKLAEFPEGYELFTHYKGDAMQSVNRKDHYLYGKCFSPYMWRQTADMWLCRIHSCLPFSQRVFATCMLARARRHNARLQVQVLYRRQPRSHAPRRTRGRPSDAEPMRGPGAPDNAGDSPHAGRECPPAGADARAERPRHACHRPEPSRSVAAALDVRPSLRGSRRRGAPVGLREGVGRRTGRRRPQCLGAPYPLGARAGEPAGTKAEYGPFGCLHD
jgi:hypothetical protein